MAGSTARLGLILPTEAEDANIDQISANFQTIDDNIGAKIATSGTRPPEPFPAQFIRETDTDRVMVYNEETGLWENVAKIKRRTTPWASYTKSGDNTLAHSPTETQTFGGFSRDGSDQQDPEDGGWTYSSGNWTMPGSAQNVWLIWFSASFAANATGWRRLYDGGRVIGEAAAITGGANTTLVGTYLKQGNTFNLGARQNSGGNLVLGTVNLRFALFESFEAQ